MDEFKKGLKAGLREARPKRYRPLTAKERRQLSRLLRKKEYSEGIY